MRAVVQRVERARVTVDGEPVGAIGRGLLALVGFAPDDAESDLEWMADKLAGLRIFADETGKMNLDIRDAGGSLLLVSQFTLYGDASRGRRPSFAGAAPPALARDLYLRFVDLCRSTGVRVETGEFAAMMDVELVNSGPVTVLLER